MTETLSMQIDGDGIPIAHPRRMLGMISRGIRRGGSFTLVIVDMDHWGAYGRDNGVAATTAALTAAVGRVAGVFNQSLTQGMAFARELLIPTEQDQLAIILRPSTAAEVEAIAAEIVAAIALPGLTASVGIATFPTDGDTLPRILNAARHGLSLAKTAGGNCWNRGSVSLAKPPAPAKSPRLRQPQPALRNPGQVAMAEKMIGKIAQSGCCG